MRDSKGQKGKVMGKFKTIRSNIESFISDVKVNDLKDSLNTMVKDAQKDFNNLVDKDLGKMKSKYTKEKGSLEKKAKKFFENHKKEISSLQAKFDKYVKAASKTPAAKSAAPAAVSTTRKKATAAKKVAKVVKKVASKSSKK